MKEQSHDSVARYFNEIDSYPMCCLLVCLFVFPFRKGDRPEILRRISNPTMKMICKTLDPFFDDQHETPNTNDKLVENSHLTLSRHSFEILHLSTMYLNTSI